MFRAPLPRFACCLISRTVASTDLPAAVPAGARPPVAVPIDGSKNRCTHQWLRCGDGIGLVARTRPLLTNIDGSCAVGGQQARNLRIHQQEHPYRTITEINWSEICSVPGQVLRFNRAASIRVFDTQKRLKVRRLAWECIGRVFDPSVGDDGRIVITGVGGNGKSHNVMLLVKELRAQSHIVLFVHDAELLTMNPWEVMMRELLFGVREAKDLSPEIRSDIAKLLQPYIKKFGATHMTKRYDALKYINGERSAFAPQGVRSVFRVVDDPLKELPTIVQMIQDIIDQFWLADPVSAPKVILVVDQDNRLQRALDPRGDNNVTNQVKMADSWIRTAPFDIKILSASANNEGWANRDWPHVIEQDIDDVPGARDSVNSVAQQVFPRTFGNRELKELVTVNYGGYPLFWGFAESALTPVSRDVASKTESVPTADAVSTFYAKVETFLTAKLDSAGNVYKNLTQPSVRNAFVTAIHQVYRHGLLSSPRYDRNLFQLVRDAETSTYSLVPICKAALMRARERFPLEGTSTLRLASSADPPRAYELLCNKLLAKHSRTVNAKNTCVASDKAFLDEDSLRLALEECKWSTKTDARFAHVITAPLKCPDYDVIVVRHPNENTRVVEVLFFQHTLNTMHRDSFKCFYLDNMHNNELTRLERSLMTLRSHATFAGMPFNVKFVWLWGAANTSTLTLRYPSVDVIDGVKKDQSEERTIQVSTLRSYSDRGFLNLVQEALGRRDCHQIGATIPVGKDIKLSEFVMRIEMQELLFGEPFADTNLP
jgi:hypothetical protein